MQHLVILEPEPWGLSLNETLLPEYLQKNAYKTHAIGKWHLGFFQKEYTPTYRGFHTHYGYWQGLQDYYEHTVHATFTSETGYDMRRNMEVDWAAKGVYSTKLFTNEAIRIINEHDTSNPIFMYVAHLAPHTGNDDNPLQAPDEEIAKFSDITDPERRIYAAMVSLLDASVGEIIAALRNKHMLENSIIVFLSDNGAQTEGIHANHGSNYPLRGLKNSPWEGATRGVAAVWSPLIEKPQRVSNDLIHITDWLPTLYSAANLNKSDLNPTIDGIDLWTTISKGEPSSRTDMLYNIDDIYNYAAIRKGDWKYLYGSTSKGQKDEWYGISRTTKYHYNVNSIMSSPVANAITGVISYNQVKQKKTDEITRNGSNWQSVPTLKLLTKEKIMDLRKAAEIKCKPLVTNVTSELIDMDYNYGCNPVASPCLFNLQDDPCEMINMASKRPIIVANLEHTIEQMRKNAVAPRNVPRDPRADPIYWNNTWTNWQDSKVVLTIHPVKYNRLSLLAITLISASCAAFLLVIVLLALITTSKPSRKKHSVSSSATEDVTYLEKLTQETL